MGRFRSGPLLGRFLRNPGAFAQKLSDLFALWRREPAVRVLLAAYARSAAARSRVRPWQLAEDLLTLSAARLGRTGGLASPKPFTVFLSLEAGSGILRLVSREAQAGAESAGLGLPELPPEARIRAVVWDHSEVGREVAVAPRPGKVRVLSLGMGGIYRFEALGEVLAVLPEVAGATVAELVRCGPVPLTSRAAALSASPAPGR